MSGPVVLGRRRIRVWTALVGAVLGLLVLGLPTPAAAHTALLGSSPSTGEELAYSPQEVVLQFAAPVATSTMQASLRNAAGQEFTLELLTEQPTTEAVIYEVSRLPHDLYGLAWESVGDDGHRVSGEVVFGVGTDVTATAGFARSTAPLDRTLDLIAVASRVAWYLGLALLAGVVVLARTRAPLVAALAARRLDAALLLVALAALLRGVVGVATFVAAGGGLAEAVLSRPLLLWVATALGAVVVRHRGRGRPPPVAAGQRPRAGGWLTSPLVLLATGLVILGTLAGHAPTRPDPAVAVLFGAVHLAAAAVWIGPLGLLVMLRRTPAWAALGEDARRSEVQAAVARIVPAAGWSFAAVATSGGLLALRAWDGISLSGGFGLTLALKAAVVVAVIVPLAIVHHRTRAGWPRIPRTAAVEVAALAGVMILGGVLVGQDPGWGAASGQAGISVAQVLGGAVDEPEDCAQLEVGRAACYRSALENVLVAEGPQSAIDIIRDLAVTNPYVTANCHQVAHDLGNDAAEQLPDLAVGLGVQDVTCWSGYIHGYVEAALARTSSGDLATELPTFCDGAATTPYNLTHYNCVHGLGHGVMLTVDGDLFESLELCAEARDNWSVQSCASGVFMENVVAAQQGLDAELDDDDLLYPCTAVDQTFVDSCFLMQTSHVLWALEDDIEAAFGWCDSAEPEVQSTCYRSMGRDLSSRALLDGPETARLCGLGDPALERWCIHGAATNAVYDQIAAGAADPICEAVDPALEAACREGQADAAAVVAAG